MGVFLPPPAGFNTPKLRTGDGGQVTWIKTNLSTPNLAALLLVVLCAVLIVFTLVDSGMGRTVLRKLAREVWALPDSHSSCLEN